MGFQLPQGETPQDEKPQDEKPQDETPPLLGRQSSISPSNTLSPEDKKGEFGNQIQLKGFEDAYLKGIEDKKDNFYQNEQFIGFNTNMNEVKSIENEMLYHNVPHFNTNNQGKTDIFNTNILELLKRDDDDDYFANSFIKESKSVKEYNKVSFSEKDKEEYKLLENITNSIVEVTSDYRNNNTKEELDKTMFLFGIPSVNIINLLRLIVDKYIIKGKYEKKLKMMTGFVEINDPEEGNIILVSISEGTFNEIDKKVIKFLKFLQSLNLELEVELPNRNMRRSKYYHTYIKKFSDNFINELIKEEFRMSRNHKGEYILASGLPNFKYPKIRFVFSHKYNADRYNGFESFVPAKKSHKCNNGSTCVEPKLFSYISDLFNTNYPSNHIIGSVAYWFNDKEPSGGKVGCAKGKYCFEKYDKIDDNLDEIINEDERRTKIEMREIKQKQNSHVRSLMARMINDKVGDRDFIKVKQNKGENASLDIGANYVKNKVDEFVLHGFALPCPGCQLNYFNFLLNKKDYWNHIFCNEKLFTFETLKDRAIRSGNLEQFLKQKKEKGPILEVQREEDKTRKDVIKGQAEDIGQGGGDFISGLKNFSIKK